MGHDLGAGAGAEVFGPADVVQMVVGQDDRLHQEELHRCVQPLLLLGVGARRVHHNDVMVSEDPDIGVGCWGQGGGLHREDADTVGDGVDLVCHGLRTPSGSTRWRAQTW